MKIFFGILSPLSFKLDVVSICSLGWPGTLCSSGLGLVLGLQACTTIPAFFDYFKILFVYYFVCGGVPMSLCAPMAQECHRRVWRSDNSLRESVLSLHCGFWELDPGQWTSLAGPFALRVIKPSQIFFAFFFKLNQNLFMGNCF